MSTVVKKSKFGPHTEDNSDWQKLVLDVDEWRSSNLEKPWPKAQQFAKEYMRYGGFDTASFRRAYNKAKEQVAGM